MASLGEQLSSHTGEIVQLWYDAWRRSEHPHADVSEALLKNSLAPQLKMIGEEIKKLPDHAQAPDELWKIVERLDPEARAAQKFTIDELVLEYGLVVDTVRDWIELRGLAIPFKEYTYFYRAVFELVAESVRRYEKHQADEVSKGRREYLAGLAHQMRSPLAVVATQLEFIEMTGGSLDKDALGRLKRNINRLLFLTNGVMRLERYDSEEIPVHPRRVYPSELIDLIVRDFEPDARHKGLILEVHTSRTLQMTIDPDLFLDAFGNLLQNAIKYTARGYVRVEIEERASEVVFRVSDSGPGISTERQEEIFQPTRPMAPGGVGIGLSIALRSIRAQGGILDVNSEVGKGSTFCMTLPREVASRYELS